MVDIRQVIQFQVGQQPMEVIDDGLMILISHIEDGLPVICQKDMRTDEHMIGINTQIIPARPYIST